MPAGSSHFSLHPWSSHTDELPPQEHSEQVQPCLRHGSEPRPHAGSQLLTFTCCRARAQLQEPAPKLSLHRAVSPCPAMAASTGAVPDPTGTDSGRAQQGTSPDTASLINAWYFTHAGHETLGLRQVEQTNSSSSQLELLSSLTPRWAFSRKQRGQSCERRNSGSMSGSKALGPWELR